MGIKSAFKYFSCARGTHHGANFCSNCGKQLVDNPYFPFRVQSLDGTLNTVVQAVSSDHAKLQFRSQYAPANLRIQRLPDLS